MTLEDLKTCLHCGTTFSTYPAQGWASFWLQQERKPVYSCSQPACMEAHSRAYAAECDRRASVPVPTRQLVMAF